MRFHRFVLILVISSSSYFGNAASPEAQDHVKIAAVQFPELVHQSEGDFLKMMADYIQKAKVQKVQIILFPELHTTNLLSDSDNPTVEILDGLVAFKDKYQSFLLKEAKENNMIIIGGTTLSKKGNKFYNTVQVAFPNGQIKTMDKTLLTPWELTHHITGVGQSAIPLNFETPWGKVAVLICYESESPKIVSKLTGINPDLVLIPSNTGKLAGLERVQSATKYIAISQFSYAMLTGVTTGYARDQVKENDVGQAIVASPPELLDSKGDQEGVFNQPDLLVVDLDMKKIRQQKTLPSSSFAARDYQLQHPSH